MDPNAGNWLTALGPFLPFGTLAAGVIWWLQRRLTLKDAVIADKDRQIVEMNRLLMERADHMTPLVVEATKALVTSTDLLASLNAPPPPHWRST